MNIYGYTYDTVIKTVTMYQFRSDTCCIKDDLQITITLYIMNTIFAHHSAKQCAFQTRRYVFNQFDSEHNNSFNHTIFNICRNTSIQ